MARTLRYLDLALLALALPVFIATADRAIAGATERGSRTAVMGWMGATGLVSAWIVALAVLLVGLIDSKHAGLEAAVLALVLFTVHLGTRVVLRLISESAQAEGD